MVGAVKETNAALSGRLSLASSVALLMMIGVLTTALKLSLTATGVPSSSAVTVTVAVAGGGATPPV